MGNCRSLKIQNKTKQNKAKKDTFKGTVDESF